MTEFSLAPVLIAVSVVVLTALFSRRNADPGELGGTSTDGAGVRNWKGWPVTVPFAKLNAAHYVGLVVFLILAFSLRYDGITFGFPLLVHPDEPQITEPAQNIARSGDFNPGTFLYPSFYIYAQTGIYQSGVKLRALRGSGGGIDEIPQMTLQYWGRLLTVMLAVATVWLAWHAALLLAGPVAAAGAALFTSVSFLHLQNSFTITTDVPMAFWTSASYLAALALYIEGPKRSYYILAGALAGLAAGTKYNGVFAIAPLIAAHFLRSRFTMRRFVDPNLYLAGLVAVVTFFATTPYALLDFDSFRRFLEVQQRAYSFGHPGNESDATSYAFYANALAFKFGQVALVLAGLGTVALLIKRPGPTLTTLAFPALYFCFMGAYRVHFDRNMVVLVPFLAILAGVGVSRIVTIGTTWGKAPTRVTGAMIASALVTFAAYAQVKKGIAYTQEITLPDTRFIAKQWVERYLPQGSKIAREAYTPPIDTRRFEVTDLGFYGLATAPNLVQYDYVIASSADFGRFLAKPERYPREAARYKSIFTTFELVKFIRADGKTSGGPSIRIYKTR